MRIGIDARCLMDKNYSGVSFYTLNLIKALLAQDQENQYCLFYNSSKSVALPEFNQPNVTYRGFRYPNKIFNLLINFFSWPKLDRLLGGVDVFFAPNLHFVAWSKNCRKIITVHDLSFLLFPEFFTVKMRLWHDLILKKKILQSADLIFADSRATKNDLLNFFALSEEKIKVNYLGVGSEFQPQDKNSIHLNNLKQQYGLRDKFFLYLGNLEPRKNIGGLIKAFLAADLPDYDLVLAGANSWKMKKIIKAAKDEPRIKFIGVVEDRPALYNLASALVYPSFYEGFGLPILEALACGCPVIAGRNSAQGEVLAEAGILVDPYNINEIKSAMELLVKDGDLCQKLITKGLERAKEFTWEKTAQNFLTDLKTII